MMYAFGCSKFLWSRSYVIGVRIVFSLWVTVARGCKRGKQTRLSPRINPQSHKDRLPQLLNRHKPGKVSM